MLIEEAAKEWELDYRLVNQLQSDGITHFFPIQRQVIPAILNGERWSIGGNPGDICVSSPTGSGKTLTYILPIVQVIFTPLHPSFFLPLSSSFFFFLFLFLPLSPYFLSIASFFFFCFTFECRIVLSFAFIISIRSSLNV